MIRRIGTLLSSLRKGLSLLFAVYILSATQTLAQEVSGWTSLEWDSASNTLYGYAETDLDDYAATYYSAALNTYIFDAQGNTLAYFISSRNTNESFVDAEISVQGTPGRTYTQNTEHLAILQYNGDCASPCRSPEYFDYYNYSSFASDGAGNVDYEGDMSLFGPGPPLETRNRYPSIPPTHSAAIATAGVCGDSRDPLMGEYAQYKVDLNPQCADFNDLAYSQYFSNSELTVNESPAYGWSLLTAEMLADIDLWRFNYGPMVVNSAYRNPAHNAAVQGAHNSRHMHGDAIDVNNPTKDQNGRTLLTNALPAGSSHPDYIEPTQLACHLNCVHAEWRDHSQTYAHTYIAEVIEKEPGAHDGKDIRSAAFVETVDSQVHNSRSTK